MTKNKLWCVHTSPHQNVQGGTYEKPWQEACSHYTCPCITKQHVPGHQALD
jgi:hypothetical protein